ncbi:mitofilin family membrane protein [Thalassobaculum salexigens]|uniref:mitofilin family membrane protein n=1 Tax=Thalassobaculum salexigens TaxID=455360 RepID=UPI00248DE70B|nr:mitofilin family membrane protein [Thalassobaculum salexigens]
MAETPKAENETGGTVSGAEGADTLSATSSTVAQDRAAGAGDDALAVGPDGASDSLSGMAASGTVDGGAGQDSLAGIQGTDTAGTTPAGTTPGPWAASSDSISGDDTPLSDPAETPEPAPTRPSAGGGGSGGGGATRLVVFLLLIVLIGGVGYATYPEWRDEAVPYAEMIGVTLPEAPAETDPDAPTPVASGDTAAPAADSTPPAASDSATSAQTDSAQTGSAQTDSAQTEPAATESGPSTSDPAAVATAPRSDPAVSAEAFEALSDRVATLEAEIDRLSEAPSSGTPTAGTDGAGEDLGERIAALESRFTALADEMAIVRQGLGIADETDGVSAVASDLSGRLSELDSRISTLETQDSGPPPVTSEDLAALRERVSGLQTASEGGDEDLVSRIDALAATQKELADKVAQGRNQQEQAGAFLLATNLLAAASNDSGAFSAELDAVESAALDQPEIDTAIGTLRTHAGGVPSEADLRSRFPTVAASIIDASLVGAGDDVVGTALTRIAALVTLRRTETADGDDIDAIVNRAEAAANAGDLPGAVAALGALDGDPAKVAQPWIAEAQARIAVDRAVRSLQSRALATLSGG